MLTEKVDDDAAFVLVCNFAFPSSVFEVGHDLENFREESQPKTRTSRATSSSSAQILPGTMCFDNNVMIE